MNALIAVSGFGRSVRRNQWQQPALRITGLFLWKQVPDIAIGDVDLDCDRLENAGPLRVRTSSRQLLRHQNPVCDLLGANRLGRAQQGVRLIPPVLIGGGGFETLQRYPRLTDEEVQNFTLEVFWTEWTVTGRFWECGTPTSGPGSAFEGANSAATVLAVTASFGMPVSTTHAITTSIMGVGCAKRFSALKLKVVERILWAWIMTLPATAGVAFALVWLMSKVGFVKF